LLSTLQAEACSSGGSVPSTVLSHYYSRGSQWWLGFSINGVVRARPCSNKRQLNQRQGKLGHSQVLGLFTVAIFGSFSGVWQKNDQNEATNDVKNEAKNGYCECSETQTFQK
jgi:hypothetical protein